MMEQTPIVGVPKTAKDDCPFCQKIVEGDVLQKYAEGIVRFEPLNPVVTGHMIFVPVDHLEHNLDAPHTSVAVGSLMQRAHFYGYKLTGSFNLIISSGADATQTVDHIHVHYVPRRPNDRIVLPWTNQRMLDE